MPDVYANQAYLTVVESAANTLTFNKLETGVSIVEKTAWLISRIDYEFFLAFSLMTVSGDRLEFGLSVSDELTAVDMSKNAVIDHNTTGRMDFGTAASGGLYNFPIQKSFADLPGGGILVPPNPLYLYAEAAGLASAVTVHARMFYTVKILKTEEFWELVELRRMIGT